MSIARISAALAESTTTVLGSSPAYVAYAASELLGRYSTIVIVTPSDAQASSLAADLRFFASDDASNTEADPVLEVPAAEAGPYDQVNLDHPSVGARLAALYRLVRPGLAPPPLTVVSAPSLARRVLPPSTLLSRTITIESGQTLNRDESATSLAAAGYTRTGIVDSPGTFSVRGSVIDVFPGNAQFPTRVELLGDEVDSLRTFDPTTQRTLRTTSRLIATPCTETITEPNPSMQPKQRILEAADRVGAPSGETKRLSAAIDAGEQPLGIGTLTPAFHPQLSSLFDYLPRAPLWILVDPKSIEELAGDTFERAEGLYEECRRERRIAFLPSEHLLEASELVERINSFDRQLRFAFADPDAGHGPTIELQLENNYSLAHAISAAHKTKQENLLDPLISALAQWTRSKRRIGIAIGSRSRRDRLIGLLRAQGITLVQGHGLSELSPAHPTLVDRDLSAGFSSAADDLALITGEEIFGTKRRSTAGQRRAAARARRALGGAIDDFSSVTAGDFLVHSLHGVGQYSGMERLPVGDHKTDFLRIEYRGGSLYLPIYRMGEIHLYVGSQGKKPRLDRLGGATWTTAKSKVRADVRALADELLQLYAQRAALSGHSFPVGDALFRDFEAAFEFEETPDQQSAIEQVIADMESSRAMDRLICGDVGYGKTEIALRSLFKAVLGGKQAAMLAPTTVLVEQHFVTMSRRFADWPVKVARLSRFQDRRSQLKTVRGIAEGSVDVVVGTHRLLSNDIRFRDLGLLVIDEEQRFGVAHKERLKRLRSNVDVLTLTATPIPRTLHFALAGLRDLSIIATPPVDRRSIRTYLATMDDQTIRQAIRQELSRRGQVFFVTPRIQSRSSGTQRSIDDWAAHLSELVPEATVAVAHGKQKTRDLESAMVAFVDGESDVLVCTSIVESGLDIPRANTMLILDADQFGLAQLYQLRGRIGRSAQRAYCYLLVPTRHSLTADARKRLEAMQRFSELGAGFAIASQDLEIRGAGELLGNKQSGSIAALGFDAYVRVLEDAIAELRGQQVKRTTDPELNTSLEAFIPDDYVADPGQRLELYRRLATADTAVQIDDLTAEIQDRYGPRPPEVDSLAALMVLKATARPLSLSSIELTTSQLTLAFTTDAPMNPAALSGLIAKHARRYALTPDLRLRCRFPEPSSPPLPQAQECILELLTCLAGP